MLLADIRHTFTPGRQAVLGAGLSLSYLSSFRGPAQNILTSLRDLF
jgi:hypothetical protein